MHRPPIGYTPLIDRPALRWPNGARVALWVQVNLEHFEYDQPGLQLPPTRPSPTLPDVKNAGWRDYGNRVGVFRLMEVLDRHGVRASAPTNAEVCRFYPEVIREAVARRWELMGHGLTNSRPLSGLSQAEERAVLRESRQVLAEAMGRPPRGWLGPGLAENFGTLDLLAEEGYEYVADWCNDDQPYPIEVRAGRLVGVPYCMEINDIYAFVGAGLDPERFYRTMCDQFDVLYAEGAATGRIYGLCLHPFIAGQAFRARWVDRGLAYILGHEGVWNTTAEEIADWYYQQYYTEALDQLRRRERRVPGRAP